MAVLTEADRKWLGLKGDEEAVRVTRHDSVLIPSGVNQTGPLTFFNDDFQTHPEGDWGCNMRAKGRMDDTLRVVFNRMYMWFEVSTGDKVIGEAPLNLALLAIKRLMSGWSLLPEIVDFKYPTIHSHLVPAGGGPVGTLGDTASAAALDTGGWISNGVQSPGVYKDITMRVPAGMTFDVVATPRKTGIVIPASGVDIWMFIALEGPGARVVPQGAAQQGVQGR